MRNVDMHVIEFISSNAYTLTDRYSTGNSEPSSDTSIGGTNDLTNVKFSLDNSGFPTVTYTRKYNTGDKYDFVLNPDTSTNFLIAWGRGTINDHGGNYKKTSIKIDSSKPVIQTTPASTPSVTSSSTPTTTDNQTTPASTPSVTSSSTPTTTNIQTTPASSPSITSSSIPTTTNIQATPAINPIDTTTSTSTNSNNNVSSGTMYLSLGIFKFIFLLLVSLL